MGSALLGLIGLTVGGVIWLCIKDRRRTALQRRIDPEYDWHPYQKGLDLMRRVAIDGSLQYRPMTDQEYQKYIADQW